MKACARGTQARATSEATFINHLAHVVRLSKLKKDCVDLLSFIWTTHPLCNLRHIDRKK